jgi:hypothetical protein
MTRLGNLGDTKRAGALMYRVPNRPEASPEAVDSHYKIEKFTELMSLERN